MIPSGAGDAGRRGKAGSGAAAGAGGAKRKTAGGPVIV
jgi:hypothetical protein